MIYTHFSLGSAVIRNIRGVTALVLLACIIALPGCGSTKVYTADKTLLYGDNLYNLANVQRLGSRVEAKLSNDEIISAAHLEKKEVKDLLDEHSTLLITTYIEMDEMHIIYQNVRIKKYSDYSKVIRNQESAMSKVNKFMADKKQTQLKLK
jgi:hypothetical protein